MDLSLNLTGPQEAALAEAAARLQVRPDELAAAAIRDLIGLPAPDFDAAATRILTQNAELYRRLS